MPTVKRGRTPPDTRWCVLVLVYSLLALFVLAFTALKFLQGDFALGAAGNTGVLALLYFIHLEDHRREKRERDVHAAAQAVAALYDGFWLGKKSEPPEDDETVEH
jgi:hypothetical protein